MTVAGKPNHRIYRWLWRQRWASLVFVSYAVLTVVTTWPIAGRLGTHIPASGGDAWVHLWTFRWVRDAILNDASPYYTNLLFYPDGVSLLFHNFAWVNIAAWLPVQAVLGVGAAYSLAFIAVFVMNGFAAYLLAREVTGSEPAAFIAGLVVAFWPYTLSHHNHPNLNLIAGVPLALLFLKRFFDRGRTRDALWAALAIAFIGFTRWQLLVIGGFIIGLYILYRLIIEKELRTPRVALLLVAAGLLAGLIMAPLLAPVLSAQLTRDNPEELFVVGELEATDLLAYFVPSRYHPLWGDAAFSLYANFGVNKVLVPFIGYSVLLLAIYGAVAAWPQSRFWLLAIFFYVILALGPVLRINGRSLIPLPYALVEDLFLIKIMRSPDRLNAVLSVPVSILAAFGTAHLLEQRRLQRRAGAIVALLAVLILAEYVVRYPTFPLVTPDWYNQLAEEPGEFGVLGIPMGPRDLTDKAYMYYQSVHGKPLVEGHVSRPPSDAFNFIDSVPLLKGLRPVENRTPDPEMVNVSEQLRQMAEGNVRYLILHKAYLSAEELASWQEWLIQDPLHEDSDLVVYRTDPIMGRDFKPAHVMTTDSDGRPEIALIRSSISPTETVQGGEFEVSAAWASGPPVYRHYDVCINLVDEDGEVVQSACQSLAPGWPTEGWGANEIVAGHYAMDVSPYSNAGPHSVTMTLRGGDSGAIVGNGATVGDLDVNGYSRLFAEPDPSHVSDVIWGEKLALPGYDLAFPEADSLAVTLYWRALQRMDTSYTAFLHLRKPNAGEIVAQADVIPRGWSYPTNWWEEGELVEDTVRLNLADVPPGEYDLFVGWYDLETGERLPASSDGEPVANGSVFLTTLLR